MLFSMVINAVLMGLAITFALVVADIVKKRLQSLEEIEEFVNIRQYDYVREDGFEFKQLKEKVDELENQSKSKKK